MKSTIGIDPLKHFPKEVWEMILEQLDPEDRGNAYQVHPLFSDLLEKNKIRDILLPKVVKIKEFQYSYDHEYDPQNYCSLRQISKSVRDFVDRMVEDNIRETFHSIRGAIFSESRFTSLYFCFDSPEEKQDVKKIISCFQGKGKTRFFLRTVAVCFPWALFNEEDDQETVPLDEQRLQDIFKEFKNDVTVFLGLVGDHILHFCLEFPRQTGTEMDPSRLIVSLDEVYMLLQRWTTMMPNLEWLELELRAHCPGRKIPPTVLEKYPFPHLASLERITINYGEVFVQSTTPQQLCGAILQANQHVKILHFDEVDDSELRRLPSNLIQSLPLTSFSVVNAIRNSSTRRCEYIQPMINLKWKLRAFKLELSDPDVSLNDLLKFLHNFPTLEYLSLDFGFAGFKIGYNGDFEYLQLPNLTDLQLKLVNPDINYESNGNVHFFFSLQFLIYCSKLKALDWKLSSFDDCKLRMYLKKYEFHEKTMDFRTGLRTLYDSNIWNVFPYLKTVQVECKKRGYGDSDIQVDPCHHRYRREEITDGKSVGTFVKEHKCCRRKNQLHNCVMLCE